MNGLRSTPRCSGAGSAMPPSAGWRASSPSQGYDRLEFSPAECGRDFPRPRRPHVRDEERAMLRRVAAEMSADRPERGAETTASTTPVPSDGAAPGGHDAAEPPPGDGRSRLYRD